MSYPFPKTARLLSKHEFKSMKSGSRRLIGKRICVDYRASSSTRLGITASGKYGSSCERNRFKRLVREAFRTLQSQFPPLEIHIVPRQFAKSAKFVDIATELSQLIQSTRQKSPAIKREEIAVTPPIVLEAVKA